MKKNTDLQKTLVVVGAKLAELRKKKGLNIKDFTRKYNLPEIQYWRIEKGKANCTIRSLSKILSVHRISTIEFFKSL